MPKQFLDSFFPIISIALYFQASKMIAMRKQGLYASTWWEGTSQFQTTQWTQLRKSELSSIVIGELYLKYRKPLHRFLLRRGFNKDCAKDLIHGFFTDKVLGQDLFDKADQSKGRFRSFLLRAVWNYAIDQKRKEKRSLSLQGDQDIPTTEGNPLHEFNRVWADEILKAALQELKHECCTHGKQMHWEVFSQWLLEHQPTEEKQSLAEIADRFGLKKTSQAYSIIAHTKTRFQRILRRRLQRHVRSEHDIDQEILELLRAFS
jgi:hypothetical protein